MPCMPQDRVAVRHTAWRMQALAIPDPQTHCTPPITLLLRGRPSAEKVILTSINCRPPASPAHATYNLVYACTTVIGLEGIRCDIDLHLKGACTAPAGQGPAVCSRASREGHGTAPAAAECRSVSQHLCLPQLAGCQNVCNKRSQEPAWENVSDAKHKAAKEAAAAHVRSFTYLQS